MAYAVRGGPFEIYSLVFFIPRAIGNAPWEDGDSVIDAAVTRGVRKASRDHAIAHFGPAAHHHLNNASNEFRVDLVDDDQGNANYYNITGNNTVSAVSSGDEPNIVGDGTPGVATVKRILDRTGFRPIETGPFNVRIILTEEPRGGLTADKINVVNGKAGTPVKGLTYTGGNSLIDVLARPISRDLNGDGDVEDTIGGIPETGTIPAYTIDKKDSQLNPDVLDYYYSNGAAVPAKVAVADTLGTGYLANYPEATGRDNKYHEYSVMITPDDDLDGEVTVSINQFMDNVLPIGNQYLPVTAEQRIATTLGDTARNVRDARVMNETITVRVSTAADTTSVGVLATAAYKTRQEDILDKVANEKVLAAKLVIPAGGYLVLGGTGVNASSAKLAEKLSAASLLYNTTDLGLPFPADDLDNFFRNGGTLNLGYSDITAATAAATGDKSQIHDDAKPSAVKDVEGDATKSEVDPEHADYTGYAGATTNAYTKGAVIDQRNYVGTRWCSGDS